LLSALLSASFPSARVNFELRRRDSNSSRNFSMTNAMISDFFMERKPRLSRLLYTCLTGRDKFDFAT